MFRQWIATHRSLAATATSGALVAVLVAVVAAVSTGYSAQRLDLSDGSVWVANSEQQAIGRANTEVLELNTVVPSTGIDLDVVQQGATVLLLDRTESTLDIIDPASSVSTDTVPLPPNLPEVYLAGTNSVVFERGTGEVWILPTANLSTFDSLSESSLSLGADAIVSVDPAGLLFAYSPTTQQVLRVNAAVSDSVELTQSVNLGSSTSDLTITSAAGRWAVLDAAARSIQFDGRSVDLAALIGPGGSPVIAWPAVSTDRLLVAYSGGLIGVPLDNSAAVALVSGPSGAAARPLALDGCEFAAWTNGDSWRECDSDGGAATTDVLDSMAPGAQLSFHANGTRAVLNDLRSGETWAVQRDGELINNWNDLIVAEDDSPEEQQNDEDIPPQVETVQQPPIAIDDAFGARPGRATVLPVLLNDYDPNGDVLVVGDLVPISDGVGRIDLINERQQIQLTLASGASGTFTFSYTLTDGRGGTDTAVVTVTVKSLSQNSAPLQVRATKAVVVSGARVATQVLGDWVDPDGDPFYLTSAATPAPDAVSYKPSGSIVFSDSGSGSETKSVSVVVSDGTAEASGSVTVTVKAAGEVPIIADPFVMLAYAGQEITVAPLEHVRGGTGTIRLNSVPAKTDVTITPSYETGTFRFTSDVVRSYYLDYVVTDGDQTVTGVIRIDVVSPPDANSKPITIPKTVFVQSLRNERIDVAGTDVDPAGGVLLVTGIVNMPPNSGVRAEVLEQRLVRVSLEAPLDLGPVTFNYRISNGLAEAEGVITVIEIPTPAQAQPPIAVEDAVTVRVGDAIDIPVLRNDEHPDGLDLTLDPHLYQELPDDSGLLFASGRVLRYLAPDHTGNFTAAYQVTGPDGQAATAIVRIAVRERDVATNNAPVPATVTARVLAGETVRISIPLTGIDPDGDWVQLLGQATNPEKGGIVSAESDTMVYQAGDYSAGTDTFTYTVIDALGARATGTVRVGISPRLEGARNPVAIIDEVTVRPGVTVSVQVLANDSDPDSSPLTIVSAVPNDPITTAEIVGDVVQVTPPPEPGSYGVIYAIENEKGGFSQNFIRVIVSADAPLAYPLVADSILTLSDVLDRSTVTVDVLAQVFFADGDPRSLGLSVYPGYGDSARVTSNKQIEVTVGDASQIIPFKVTHPDDDSVFSYGFIRVPGFDDALPQLDRRAPRLQVNSEDELVIDLNDYIIAVGGKQVRLTDSSTVSATHSNGSDLVQDEDTLVFTSAEKYFGPASIAFEVTDGSSASDPTGRRAILVLPIIVLPRENQPPAFGGAVIDFEPGQEKEIDLLKLTDYPYPDDLDELVYSVLNPLPVGFTHALNDNILTLRADSSAVDGTVTSMSIGVRDDLSEGLSGRISLTIVQSTSPLLKPAADVAILKRGETAVIDVLANDEATNPFPGEPLTVVDIRGLDGGALPAGIQVVPSEDKSTLTATISATAEPVDVTIQYQVADVTGDPNRYVWGTVTISVQDRPDPVTNVAAASFGDREVTIQWNAGAFNNSPITNYRVVTTTPGGGVVGTSNCSGTTCTIGTPGNGSSNEILVTVYATNSIGDSDPTTIGSGVWSDIIPSAPGGVSAEPLDHGLSITWDQVPDPAGGTPVSSYVVRVGGVSVSVGCGSAVCSTDVVDGSIANGSLVTYSVSARNDAYGPLAGWNATSQQATPAGPPIATSPPVATAVDATEIGLNWTGSFNSNGRPITEYTAAAFSSTAPTCSAAGTVTANGATLDATGTGTTTSFSGLSPNTEYTFIVFAFNGQGCSESASVIAHTPPTVITALTTSGPSANGEYFDFTITGGAMGADSLTSDFTIIYRLSGGTVQGSEYGPIALGDFLTADGTQYAQSISVEARACRNYGAGPVCQATWSAPFALGMPVDAHVSGLVFTQDDPDDPQNDGTFSWLGWPVGYEAVEFACGTSPGGPFVAAGADLTCHVDAGPPETPYLTIRVTANGGQTYDLTLNAFDFD